MIVKNDASTPCDERHDIQKIPNVNLSTQKKTGGNFIMGNQGMTNWKFSAFLAIALMLVAGLFSTTAMAADGDGQMSITTPDEATRNNLEAGSTILSMAFSYGAAPGQTIGDMAGGLVQMTIPADWKFTADDAASIVAVTAGGTLLSGPTDKTVRIQLASDLSAAMTFTLTNIVVPIPDRLTDGDRSYRYEEYEFTTYSRTRSGNLRKLDPIVERGDLDSDPATPDTTRVTITQARVRVGNIAAATSGKVAITPEKAYETYNDPVEGPHRFVIKFTADGPMWNSRVNILFPGEIDNLEPDDVRHLRTASGSLTPTGNSGSFRLVNTGGAEVSFAGVVGADVTGNTLTEDASLVGDGVGDDAAINTAQVVAIDVKSMDKGQGFEIIYYSKLPEIATGTFSAAASTRRPLTITADANTLGDLPVPVALAPAADRVKGGMLLSKDGSGTMMAVPMYVEIDSGVKQFELRYTAATLLRNTTLAIQIPVELLGTSATPAFLQDPDGDTAADTILRSKIGTSDDKRNSSNAGYVYTTNNYARELLISTVAPATGHNTITWRDVSMSKGQVFRTIVRLATSGAEDTDGSIEDDAETAPDGGRADVLDDAVYPLYTTMDASSGATRTLLADADDANLYAVRGNNADVMFHVMDGAVPGTDGDPAAAIGTSQTHVTYAAAATETIRFRFRATNTSIKGGTVSFRMPSAAGWTTPAKPNADADNAGRLTAHQYTNDAAFTAEPNTGKDLKDKITPGQTVTVAVDALPQGGFIDIVYTAGVVQYTADTVDIIGEFETRSGARSRRAGRVEVEVTNVADGSGEATISPSGANATARAGSTDNTITIKYTAAGTMSGGQVAFEIPANWGDMQGSNAQENNHVSIQVSGGTLDATNPAYIGRRIAVANLERFEKGNTVTFTYSNAEAPSVIGIEPFLVSSAGASPIDAGRDLMALAGKTALPTNWTDEDVLGALYKDDGGRLRVKVISAADGTGEATVEIRNSSSPTGKYGINAEGEADADAVTQQVHAGDTSVYLLFTYTPHETITDGELEFTVPADWTIPQGDDQGKAGYTYFEEVRNADIGSAVISGTSRTISVEIIHMTKDDSVQIHYGWHGVRAGGAEAPDDADTDTFGFRIKGSADGQLANMRTTHPTVMVRPAAGGSGTAAINPASAAAADMETVTITYTAAGEIVDGALRLTIPARTDPATWADASSENITVSGGGGSADHGAQYYESPDDDGDETMYEALPLPADRTKVPGIRQVVYSGINLAAGGTVTFTYNTQVGATIGSHTFKLEFQGGGVNLSATDPYAGFATVADLAISVGEAAAGTGTVEVDQDSIKAGDTDAEITFIYTAAGEIDYPGTFAVGVPTGWGAAPTAASYEVAYQSVDKNGVVTTLTGTAQSVEEAAPSGQMMVASIRGAASPRIGVGNQIVFTYTSAAPDTAGSYSFPVYYDDVMVGEAEVLVLSAEEASMVSVSVTDDLTAAGTAIPVTVNLLADDGMTAATRNTALTVTLSSAAVSTGAAAGMFSLDNATFTSTVDLTFMPGQNMMMAYYQDAAAAVATITATPDTASGLAAATADVDTEVISVGPVTFTVNDEAGMYATTDDTVMITVEATPKRTTPPTVTIGSVASLATTEDADMLGTYTAEWTVVADVHDGTHPVSATLGDLDPVAASAQLTVDTLSPTVTITSPVDATVVNGGSVTITATVADGDKSSGVSTVTADVSALDNTQTEAIALSMSNGAYSRSYTISAANTAVDGSRAIEVMATDNAGNTGSATAMVTLDNTAPVISSSSADMMYVKNGDMLEVSAMVTGANTVSADVSALNADAPMLDLMDADDDGEYTGSVMVTATGDGEQTITITAADAAGSSTDTVMVTLDNMAPVISSSSADMMNVKNGDMLEVSAMVTGASEVSADVSMLNADAPMLDLMDADADGEYTGSVEVTATDNGDKTITITAADAAGNMSEAGTVTVTLDNTVPEVTDVSVGPSPTRNGHEVTISAMVSEASTVMADVSDLDTMQTEMVALTDDDGDGTYTGSHMISEDNEADNGSRTVSVTATDAAGNSSEAATGTVELINTIDYTSMIPADISMFHVPLDVTAIDGQPATLSMVSDLYDALGDAVNYLITTDDGGANWNTYIGGESGDAAITADRGIVLVMKTEKTITFTGNAWGDGASMINLKSGNNIVGVPVMDPNISTVSDLMDLPEFAGKVTSILADDFAHVVADGAADVAVRGDAAYFVSANADASQAVSGDGWSTGETGSAAAPIALLGRTVDNQTPTLFVEGSLVDELTGLAKDGFRIKVKNLSTKAALSAVSQGDVAQGYNMTFVDLNAGNAARVGDVLEISADSPNPLIGVRPVRHIVTVDDVKNSRIELEDLIAYEIPAETELLRNYPNPFNPETWIPYHLSEDADVSLTIYDATGILVRTIDLGHQIAAKYDTRSKAIYWDGRNRFGEQVASGIYFYSLSAGDFSATRKMVILK